MTWLRRAWFGEASATRQPPQPLGWAACVTVLIAVVVGVIGALEFARGHFARGGTLLLAGAIVLHWPRVLQQADDDGARTMAHERLALLVVCVIGVFFRTYQLEPPGLWGDEAINGLRAFEILDGTITSPFQLVTHPHTFFHALTNYPIAAAFRLFGAGPVTLRLPGIIAGIACVPLLYATAAPLFGARVALIAALFFACSPMQIAHAKGLTQIVFGECAQLAGICLTVRGLYGRRHWLIAAAGIPFGLCVYMYHSAKIAPLVALVLFLWPLVKREAGRPALRWWLGAAGYFILTALPGVLAYVYNPGALTGRATGVALWPMVRERGTLWPLWDAVWRTLTIYHYQQGPVDYHWFGLGTDPGSNAIVAFFAIAGMLASLWRWRETRHGLLLACFFLGLLPGILSTEAPRGYRVLYASPPIYIWAALPLGRILCAAASSGWAARTLRIAVTMLVIAVPLVDFNIYFYRVYTNSSFRWFQAQRMVEMARTLRSYGPGWTGVLLSDSFDARYETLLFLTRAWGLTLRNASSFANELPVREPGSGVLFIFDGGSIPASVAPRAFYPDVSLDVREQVAQRSWWLDQWLPLGQPSEPLNPVAAFFPVSAETAAAAHDLTATFTSSDGASSVTRMDHNLDFTAASAPPGVTGWTGAIDAPSDGLYELVLQSAGEATVRIDGREMVTNEHPTALEPLAQGLHPLSAEVASATTPNLRLQWRPPGISSPVTIGPEAFFRIAPVFGLRAEYEVAGRSLVRIEPYPYYAFFAPTFSNPFTVHWRGSLHVPANGYRFEWHCNGQPTVTIDGQPAAPLEMFAAGRHELDLLIRGVPPTARLQFYWHRPGGTRELVPPQAFEPIF